MAADTVTVHVKLPAGERSLLERVKTVLGERAGGVRISNNAALLAALRRYAAELGVQDA